jgi:hypothetical protein
MAVYPKSFLRDTGEYKITKKQFDALFTGINVGIKVDWLSQAGVLLTRYQRFKENWSIFHLKLKKTREVANILVQSATITYPDKQIESMNKMFSYMGLVESLGITMMNMALLFLIANGKEIHSKTSPSMHVETYDDLERLWDVEYKLKFLDSAGISIFSQMIIIRNVRNMVAHLNFSIDTNGEIRDSGRNKINIDRILTEFFKGIAILELVLEDINLIE